jgi:hypothetical protein
MVNYFAVLSNVYCAVRAFRRGELDIDLFPERVVVNDQPQSPIERAFWELDDKYTPNHTRKRF